MLLSQTAIVYPDILSYFITLCYTVCMKIKLNDAAIEYMKKLGFSDIVLLTDSSKT